MKTILFVGGNGLLSSAVIKAKKMGYYTIVADLSPHSLARQYSDESITVDCTDFNRLMEICLEKKVDSIYSGYSDTTLPTAALLCEKLHFPFYTDYATLLKLTDKKMFKKLCNSVGIGTIDEYCADALSINNLPVIIKPVDNCGGRGISVCNSIDHLNECIELAKDNSHTGEYLIEKYMDSMNYPVVNLYYSMVSGDYQLSMMADGFPHVFENGRTLCTRLDYPSKYLSDFVSRDNDKFKELFKKLGIKFGSMFVEGCVDSGQYKFWECGFRQGGAQHNLISEYCNGTDIETVLLKYSLGLEIPSDYLEDPYLGGKYACNLLIFVEPGIISAQSGFDTVCDLEGVINFTAINLIMGKSISESDIGTLNQCIGRFHIVANSREEIQDVIGHIYDHIKVFDQNGNNIVKRLV